MSSCGEWLRSQGGHPGRGNRGVTGRCALIFVGLTFKVPIRWLDSVPRAHLPAHPTVSPPWPECRVPPTPLGTLQLIALSMGHANAHWL